MKLFALVTALLLCCSTSIAFAGDAYLGAQRPGAPPKDPGVSTVPNVILGGGGDTIADPIVIPALPYGNSGTTCGFNNDYTSPCASSSSPDVVYVFRPTSDVCVDIDLCNSSYDTQVFVYSNNTSTVIACQDDSPDCGLQSHLQNVPLAAGNVYYIVVEGYASNCGDYNLSITECPPPPVCEKCPPTSVPEGEVVCSDGYLDTYNAGCNSDPVTVKRLDCEPSITVCGTYGTFDGNFTRDTDWYEFTVTDPTTINVSVTGGGLTGSALAILDTSCPPNILCGSFVAGDQCEQFTCSAPVGPGTYRVFVASFFDGTPCGSQYVLNITDLTCPPVPANATSWGKVKNIYR
jgi:hypothetical protein